MYIGTNDNSLFALQGWHIQIRKHDDKEIYNNKLKTKYNFWFYKGTDIFIAIKRTVKSH